MSRPGRNNQVLEWQADTDLLYGPNSEFLGEKSKFNWLAYYLPTAVTYVRAEHAIAVASHMGVSLNLDAELNPSQAELILMQSPGYQEGTISKIITEAKCVSVSLREVLDYAEENDYAVNLRRMPPKGVRIEASKKVWQMLDEILEERLARIKDLAKVPLDNQLTDTLLADAERTSLAPPHLSLTDVVTLITHVIEILGGGLVTLDSVKNKLRELQGDSFRYFHSNINQYFQTSEAIAWIDLLQSINRRNHRSQDKAVSKVDVYLSSADLQDILLDIISGKPVGLVTERVQLQLHLRKQQATDLIFQLKSEAQQHSPLKGEISLTILSSLFSVSPERLRTMISAYRASMKRLADTSEENTNREGVGLEISDLVAFLESNPELIDNFSKKYLNSGEATAQAVTTTIENWLNSKFGYVGEAAELALCDVMGLQFTDGGSILPVGLTKAAEKPWQKLLVNGARNNPIAVLLARNYYYQIRHLVKVLLKELGATGYPQIPAHQLLFKFRQRHIIQERSNTWQYLDTLISSLRNSQPDLYAADYLALIDEAAIDDRIEVNSEIIEYLIRTNQVTNTMVNRDLIVQVDKFYLPVRIIGAARAAEV